MCLDSVRVWLSCQTIKWISVLAGLAMPGFSKSSHMFASYVTMYYELRTLLLFIDPTVGVTYYNDHWITINSANDFVSHDSSCCVQL